MRPSAPNRRKCSVTHARDVHQVNNLLIFLVNFVNCSSLRPQRIINNVRIVRTIRTTNISAGNQVDGVAMTKHFVGLTVEEAKIASIDALGMNVAVKRDGETFKIRLPFEPGPATDRKAVKDAMVGMTKTAMKAAAGEKAEKETAQTE